MHRVHCRRYLGWPVPKVLPKWGSREQARKDAGLSRETVANAAGCSFYKVRNIEKIYGRARWTAGASTTRTRLRASQPGFGGKPRGESSVPGHPRRDDLLALCAACSLVAVACEVIRRGSGGDRAASVVGAKMSEMYRQPPILTGHDGGRSLSEDASAPPPPPAAAKTASDPAPAPKPKPKAKAKASVKRFSGSGGKTLAPFTLNEDSTLRWTNNGGIFQIFDSIDDPGAENAGVPVNSQAKSGDSFLKAGEHKFQVNAAGDWTIRITPGS